MIAQIRRLAWSAWHRIAARAARAYVAGPELEHALNLCGLLSQQRMETTICRWNSDGESPQFVAESYSAALRGIGATGLNCYLSIKAPALGFSRDLVESIFETSRSLGIGLHFDSLAPDVADDTWALIKEVATRHRTFGCTLPARWRRSQADAELAVDLALGVRIVKGQWPDTDETAADIRRDYMRLIERLAGRANRVAVATHDPRLLRSALECLRSCGTPCEVELLYGLPSREPLRIAEAIGVPVRFYIPYGHAWVPYCLSQVRDHPSVLLWTVKDWILGWRWPASRAKS